MTLNKKELNHRIARWALELENYNYSLEHRKGERMQHVDALSRNNVMVVEANSFEDNLIICHNRDEKLRQSREILENKEHKSFEMRNGVIYKKKKENGSILFYVPEAIESSVIYKYHDELGHVGIDKVVDMISKSYWFPNVKEKVSNHIQNCLRCVTFSDKVGRKEGFIHNTPKGNNPFEVLHIDHIGPLENFKNCKKHILVVVDSVTKFTRLYPTKTTKSKEAIQALKDYLQYSRPRCIISDRGSCFTSNEFVSFLSSYNVQHIKVATGSPQANGQVERVNRSIGPMLAKLSDPARGIYWDKTLESVEHAINNTLHRSVNEHPSIMLFGVNQKGKVVDSLKENMIEAVQGKVKKTLEEVRKCARISEQKLQSYNTNYVNSKRRSPIKYVEGDYVMVRNFDSHVGISKKLIPKFKGPYSL